MKIRIARYTMGMQGNSFATCLYCSRTETSAYLTKGRMYKWSRRDFKVEETSAVCFSRGHCLLLSAKPSFLEFFSFFFARVAICELLFLAVASAMRRPGFYRKRVALKFHSSFPFFLSAHFIILPFLADNNPPRRIHIFIFMLNTCLAEGRTKDWRIFKTNKCNKSLL